MASAEYGANNFAVTFLVFMPDLDMLRSVGDWDAIDLEITGSSASAEVGLPTSHVQIWV